MMNCLWIYLSFSFFLVMIYFFLESSNFLNMVLILELLSMILYFCLYLYFYNFSFSILLYFLIMSVCEGSISLSLVVLMVRIFGDVMFKSMNLTLC